MENDLSSKNEEEDPMIGKLIFDRYRLIKRLGAGSFGCIYSAEYENKYYAIKLEEKKEGYGLLEHESTFMTYLRSPALPIVKAYGYSSTHNILVMELMGKSLEDIFEKFDPKKFSVRCVCNIGYQMIEILEFIHNKNVIHRDIKPDNFVIGLNDKRKYIYILDFGLAKKYRSSKTLQHYAVMKSKNLTGTARYASINALDGLTQSRRDDLEAVGYVLLYFLRGRLPWQGIPVKNKEERYRKIKQKKIDVTAEELCQGFPMQFVQYINYTRNLEYEQDPNYHFLKNLFTSVLSEMGHKVDCYYDWDTETINYYRDFSICGKNYESSSVNNISKNNTTSNGTTDINSRKKDNKAILRFDKTNYENSNNISLVNNITSRNFINGSVTNDYSVLNQKKVETEFNLNSNILQTDLNNKNTTAQVVTLENNNNLNNMENKNIGNNPNENKGGQTKKKEEDGKCCIIF